MFDLQFGLGEALLDSASWYHPSRYREAETHLKNARSITPKDPRPDRALERLRKKTG